MDETLLAERCKQGDPQGLREFLERFQGPVFGVCLRWLGHRQDAEDVAQETLVRAVRHLKTWDATRPLLPWVLAIAVNRCRTFAGKRNRRGGVSLEQVEIPPAPRERMSTADLGEELAIALGELRDEYRTCFVLFYQQEQSCQEIADIMNCPEGTIKTWLHRARKELAESLKRRGVVTEDGYELHGF